MARTSEFANVSLIACIDGGRGTHCDVEETAAAAASLGSSMSPAALRRPAARDWSEARVTPFFIWPSCSVVLSGSFPVSMSSLTTGSMTGLAWGGGWGEGGRMGGGGEGGVGWNRVE